MRTKLERAKVSNEYGNELAGKKMRITEVAVPIGTTLWLPL